MALTPEDVINKRFQPTKFREGYDQDEVDDFLDEIVVELRRLNQENAELKQQLESGEAPAQPAEETSSEEPAEAEPTETKPAEESAPAVEETPAAPAAPEPQPAPAGDSAQSAAGVLAMAQRLHDEYVANGQAEHDRLVADGRTEAERMIAEAQQSKDEVLASLEQERGALEQQVSGLRSFEKNYRERLKEFISGQLEEIETAPPVVDGDSES